MDGKLGTFLLGVIAAVVLVMLWKKGGVDVSANLGFGGNGMQPGGGGGCSGCAGSCGNTIDSCLSPGASGYAAPAAQGAMAMIGLDGMISPGTPPLNSVTGGQGATSFYDTMGVTTDASFTFTPVARNRVSVGSPLQPPVSNNVPGSASTPATVTPTRATQQVPTYAEQGFIPRYSISGTYVH
jgi:hypothetical protein